ncbi:MAG TPA: hypothetical protein VHM66_11840 [Solirubrobacterales bacterium]|jgi:NADPH-dependent 2,4-dienoyl-CoA reductase/sulfur reductase-like enzyme|nr:hypothetical protein [Solirubrobacterales bacterium]
MRSSPPAAPPAELPVLIDGDRLGAAATIEMVAQEWGVRAAPLMRNYDIAIVGAGPAGLAPPSMRSPTGSRPS